MGQARDYQRGCHDAVLAAWGEAPWYKEGDMFQSVLANLATSAGKTFIAGLLIQTVRERGNCLFLADTNELCAQPTRTLYRQFGIHPALEKSSKRASIMADVVVGSAQTLIRPERLNRYSPDHFKYIFVDEAHRGSDRNKVITDHFPDAKIMGMTATAFRAKLKDLSAYYEHVAFELGVFDLIDEGYIAPLKVLTLPVVIDIRNVHQTMTTDGMDYDKNELDTSIRPYYEEICRLILEKAPGRRIICYLPLIKSSQEFAVIAQSMGISARHIDGKSPDREKILAQFERGDFQMLCNSSLLTTGWDCPPCDCLVNLAPTRFAGLFRQKVGRIGRTLPGVIDGIATKEERRAAIADSAKPDALILDFLWQTEKFGLIGPADLIAGNSDERLAIQMAINRLMSPEDLQKLAIAVQKERETALKKALQDAAKRRSSLNDAINLVAALLHSKKVADYEPVMAWEGKAVTSEQKKWLEKQGIDPASAKDRGHVAAFMNLIFGRRRAKLCTHRAVEALEKMGVEGAISFTHWQAYEVLRGNFPISFGKYASVGKPLREIATSYWEYCMKQDWFAVKRLYPVELEWARDVLGEPGGCKCIGNYVPPNCPVHPRPGATPAAELTAEQLAMEIKF